MAEREIVLATGNPGKLREIRQVLGPLGVRVLGLDELPPIPEPPETGDTFAENARQKALAYAAATGRWCLADDSGLVVDALDGAPGIHSARYAADRLGSDADRSARDAANNAKLLEELAETSDQRRTARFVCHLALAEPGRVLLDAEGTVEGRILREARGTNGFGYDPLFLLPDLGRTAAELAPEAKNAVSHRGGAVRQFADKIAGLLASPSARET